MRIIYNLLAILIVLLAIPAFMLRLVREDGFGRRLKQSFGFLPEDVLQAVVGQDCLWLHAASVGEVVAASPLVKEMRRAFPERKILLSVVTAGGYDMAQRIIKDADAVMFFPLDLPWLSRAVLRKINPAVFMMVETELWPNFLAAARDFAVPVMMVNGRISDKSHKRYRYLFAVLQDMLNTVQRFCMQSLIDAQYIIALGADPRRVVVTGNTKFDQTYTEVPDEEQMALRESLGVADAYPVIVAGSTHKGEEEAVLTAFLKVKAQFPQAKLILAPREILRAEEIGELISAKGCTAIRRTALQQGVPQTAEVMILDSIGELGRIYSLAEVVFVGGSLIPRGGHNILEPAAHGKPIVVGPHMFNFKDTYALFSGRKACRTVQDSKELGNAFLELLQDHMLHHQMSQETLKIIKENQGAAQNSILYLQELLAGK